MFVTACVSGDILSPFPKALHLVSFALNVEKNDLGEIFFLLFSMVKGTRNLLRISLSSLPRNVPQQNELYFNWLKLSGAYVTGEHFRVQALEN